MKRAAIGDLYCMKVPNGYKLYQWAYSIQGFGYYIRVFHGLYSEIPSDLESVVNSEHDYIIGFAAGKAYRLKLAELLGNFPVPVKYPVPEFSIGVSFDGRKICAEEFPSGQRVSRYVHQRRFLPPKYRKINMLKCSVTPDYLMFLFDTGFDLSNWKVFTAYSDIEKYTNIVNSMLPENQQIK